MEIFLSKMGCITMLAVTKTNYCAAVSALHSRTIMFFLEWLVNRVFFLFLSYGTYPLLLTVIVVLLVCCIAVGRKSFFLSEILQRIKPDGFSARVLLKILTGGKIVQIV